MTDEYLAELVRVQIEQLEERMAEQNRELGRRIEDLQAAQENLAAAVLARIDAHEDYHRQNEHRWGLVKLAARHPFRFAALAGMATVTASAVWTDSSARLAEFLAHLTKLLP